MTSFIELPRLTFNGQPQASAYINVADIVCLEPDWSGQINVAVRDLRSQGMGIVQTYVPLQCLLDALNEVAGRPGVRSWADSVKDAWASPVAHKLEKAWKHEREG